MKLTAALLADAARVESGKLYVHGGGWDSLWSQTAPVTHPSMALVLLFRFEYSDALENTPVTIELLDDDNNPMPFRIEQQLNVGHPPGTQRGSAIFVPQAITIAQLLLPKFGGYEFRVTSGHGELASVPLRLVPATQPGLPLVALPPAS